ncbi:hypothetical protein HZH68_012560 [Vespula germanica]|uniref:Transmembrane protein n=1 Tax=Vespula germanica TaxID=30212 RepID=A0A834JH71_VESGE|nr:hypothetical protein HZH68_012560 [Vespula germanica]
MIGLRFNFLPCLEWKKRGLPLSIRYIVKRLDKVEKCCSKKKVRETKPFLFGETILRLVVVAVAVIVGSWWLVVVSSGSGDGDSGDGGGLWTFDERRYFSEVRHCSNVVY